MIGIAITTGCMAGIAAAVAAREWVIERRLEKLHAPLPGAPPREAPGLRWRTRDTALAEIAAASLLDVGVALARVEPQVLDAIDLAHGDDAFQSFAALQAHIVEVMDRGDVAFDGLVSQYKGSLGEILAAEHLTTAGHDVVFAEHPNQEGWDILVDGEPVQVKSGLDDGGIESALADQPDVAIVTVQEHADLAAQGEVAALPVSGVELTESTAESLEAIAGFGDLLPEIPLVSAFLHGAGNMQAYGRGEISGEQAVAATAVGVATSAAGAAIGSALIPIPFVGAAIGVWATRQFVNGVIEAEAQSGRETHEARQRRERFEQEMGPVLEALAADLEVWRYTVILAATVGATAARHSAARMCTRQQRPWWAIPTLSDFIREAARARFEQEAVVLDTLALAFGQTGDMGALLEQWQATVPRLGGLAECDARVCRTLRRAEQIARKWKQAPVLPTARARGPRPSLFIGGRPPWRARAAKPWVMCAVILGGSTAALASLPADVGSAEVAARSASVPRVESAVVVVPTPAPERQVEVTVERCRIRADATTKSAIVGKEGRGTLCAVDSQSGGWARVRCPSGMGFMHEVCFRDRPDRP